MADETTVAIDGKEMRVRTTFTLDLLFRPGGFGARDYRNPAQLRGGRGGGGRPGGSAGGFNHHPQPWDGSNGGAGGSAWAGDHPSAGGYDRFQQPMTNSNGNRPADQSWWDSTS